MLITSIFSSPEHEVLGVSYCDHLPSIGVHPSVRSHFLVYTLASTNINQSAPNFIKIYMNLRSLMSSIMGLIEPEHLKLFALELKKNAIFHFVYTLASTSINLSVSNLVKIYMTIRSRMSSIIGLI